MKYFFPVLAAALLAACGGGGSGGMMPATPLPAATTAVQVNIGDDPADRLLAATVTINSVALTSAAGSPVVVMSSPRPMEMMRLMGTVAPLAIANVPQGTYTGATITFGGATVLHMDPSTGQAIQRQVSGPMSASVTFPSPMVVGASPMVVNLDMNMALSIAIDSSGNVAMSPMLTGQTGAMRSGGVDPEDGGMRGITGMVGTMGGTGSFTFSAMQGLSGMSMATGPGTQYAGMSGMGMMGGGLMISVDAMPQPDGSWSVSNVQWRMAAGGSMAGGVVLSTTGNPVTQVVLAMHDGAGTGMGAANLAGTTTATIGDATTFSIASANVDVAGLPFTPTFDRASLSKGQRIEVVSAAQATAGGGMGGMMGGSTVTATSVRLGPQGVRGTVSSYVQSGTSATFTLALSADSAFAKLTGATSITVYQQASTELRGASTITNGSTVEVRGLLFNDAGTLRMVAGRIRS